jgi:hypothetical protein
MKGNWRNKLQQKRQKKKHPYTDLYRLCPSFYLFAAHVELAVNVAIAAVLEGINVDVNNLLEHATDVDTLAPGILELVKAELSQVVVDVNVAISVNVHVDLNLDTVDDAGVQKIVDEVLAKLPADYQGLIEKLQQ